MDMLEVRQEESYRQAEKEHEDLVDLWKRTVPVRTLVCGPYFRAKLVGKDDEGVIYARTKCLAYLKDMKAVVDVDGKMAVPIWHLFRPEGSSPALAVPCRTCGAKVGRLCTKFESSEEDREQVEVKQQIAHKDRREASKSAGDR